MFKGLGAAWLRVQYTYYRIRWWIIWINLLLFRVFFMCLVGFIFDSFPLPSSRVVFVTLSGLLCR